MGHAGKRSWKEAAFFTFAATAADIDYLPGVLVGNPLLFHQSITHSLAFAFIFGLVVALAAKAFKKYSFFKLFLLSSAVYATHPLLDLFTSPVVSLLWPFHPVDLAQQFTLFRSLPLCRDGLKDFACERLLSFSCIQRFWRESFLLGPALTLFFSRDAIRRFFAHLKRRPIFTNVPSPCAD
jgi:hypothetical protein